MPTMRPGSSAPGSATPRLPRPPTPLPPRPPPRPDGRQGEAAGTCASRAYGPLLPCPSGARAPSCESWLSVPPRTERLAADPSRPDRCTASGRPTRLELICRGSGGTA
eukprot:3421750-Pleurochrysis_carterae.AAC.1